VSEIAAGSLIAAFIWLGDRGIKLGAPVMNNQLGQYWAWLEYDPIALAVLVTGIGIVLMLAVSI
jgi:hypothetical protein